MSAVETTKEVTKVETVLDTVTVTCDGCGLVAPGARPLEMDSVNWLDDPYKYLRITVKRETGASYRDNGGDAVLSVWHICPTCWDEMSAWIRARRGATATKTEYDW